MGKASDSELKVFKTSETLANMRKDRFVVPQHTTLAICKKFVLTTERQSEVVEKLVDRTPHWLDLSEEEQVEEIKAALVLNTIAEYLYKKGYITKQCTMYENGFDRDGNIVLDAFYVKESKLQDKIKTEFENKRSPKKKDNVVSFVDRLNQKESKVNGKHN